MATITADAATVHNPLVPVPYRVVATRRHTDDVTTLSLVAFDGAPPRFGPGQFNMLTVFGVGEVAISMSSSPDDDGPLEHTVRDVGAVTHALCAMPVGGIVGVRGPFGNDWGTDALAGDDAVVVAGGIGLAPLRGAVQRLVATLHTPSGPARLYVLVGARSPDQIVFADDLERWRQAGAEVAVTVDVAEAGWRGRVGVVTTLLPAADFDPARTSAIMCGPEVMMRFTVRDLMERGVDRSRIKVTLERNMQCGIGLCGHCQLGPYLLCRDGPIFDYAASLEQLLLQRQR
ncbi:MAG: FAD/NAD(P)-binding protein [Acidimicrobiales bacterium]